MKMSRLLAALVAVVLATAARAEDKKPAAPAAPAAKPAAPAEKKFDADKALYGVGLSVARSLEVFNLQPNELGKVIAGIQDGVAGKGKYKVEDVQGDVQELARTRLAAQAEKEKTKGAAYLEKEAKEKGAVKTESGAIVIPLKEGTGASPKAEDKVKVHYTGTLVNGKEFDSSRTRGQPAEFPLNQVVKCWTEALQKMKVGGRAKIVCPSAIAYGEQGRPPVIPGNAVLTFDVELLDIVK